MRCAACWATPPPPRRSGKRPARSWRACSCVPGRSSGPAPMPPRAAVDPAAPARLPVPPTPPIPPVTPVAPPERAPNPIPDGRGGVVVPAGKNAVDPRTGAWLIDVGNGYLDPATGRFVPKN